jgi:hypothetical protein
MVGNDPVRSRLDLALYGLGAYLAGNGLGASASNERWRERNDSLSDNVPLRRSAFRRRRDGFLAVGQGGTLS